jgi:hypothetical protein
VKNRYTIYICNKKALPKEKFLLKIISGNFDNLFIYLIIKASPEESNNKIQQIHGNTGMPIDWKLKIC